MLCAAELINELKARNLCSQHTDEPALIAHLNSGSRSIYVGFDPTADSLTIGNLVPIMLLKHFQLAGHRPVVVMGGGTGLIGDPSGKDAERRLLDEAQVRANVESQSRIFRSILDFDGPNAATIVNNADWLTELSYVGVLRDVGKHFSVNAMMQKDSVRTRLESREQGISYTEFSYMILQSYDYLHLHREQGVSIQGGGSDQWGNITMGIDLIRKVFALENAERTHEAHGLVAPLITKADGGKFGKSETGAVWLTPERTSPYQFYQFWLNTSDADAISFLNIFTLVPRDEIREIERDHADAPQKRLAQTALAQHATALLYSERERDRAIAASRALFTGDVADLDAATIADAFADVPSSAHDATALDGPGVPLLDLLVTTGLAKSKREAREFLANGAVTINGHKAEPDSALTRDMLLHSTTALLRRGKKAWHVTTWV